MTLEEHEASLRAGHADIIRALTAKAELSVGEQSRAMITLAVFGHALAELSPRLGALRDRVIEIENAKGPREAGLLGLGECQA
jgi:hypothetical protein